MYYKHSSDFANQSFFSAGLFEDFVGIGDFCDGVESIHSEGQNIG
jgi:hypothetical protein